MHAKQRKKKKQTERQMKHNPLKLNAMIHHTINTLRITKQMIFCLLFFFFKRQRN